MKSNSIQQRSDGWFRDTVVALSFVTAVCIASSGFSQSNKRNVIKLPGASVHGFQVTQISAKLGGFVKSIGTADNLEIDVGSSVKKGTVLAELDIPEMQNELAEKLALVTQSKSAVTQADAAIIEAEATVTQRQAALEQVKAGIAAKKAMLNLNEATLNRLTRLADGGTIGKDNLDEAEFNVAVAQAALVSVDADIRAAQANIEAAKASVNRAQADKVSAQAKVKVAEAHLERLKVMMNYTVIKAPYDGIITRREIDLGSYVLPAEKNSAAMPMFELTQVSKVRVMVAVPNNSVAKIRVGQTVEFSSIGGLEGRIFKGTVTRTAGALDPKSRTMQIECHIDNPAIDSATKEEVELKPGLFGTLSVTLGE